MYAPGVLLPRGGAERSKNYVIENEFISNRVGSNLFQIE